MAGNKRIAWNHNRLLIPREWEVTSEGGTSINGVIVAAPPKGMKFELYWIRRKRNEAQRYLESYEKKLRRHGFERKGRLIHGVAGHRAVLDVLADKEGDRVFVASWFCDRTGRQYLAQLDGPEASLPTLTTLLGGLSCHPFSGDWAEWRLLGLRLMLPRGYFVDVRDFRIGFSYAYFMSRDKKTLVLQYAVPEYVLESHGGVLDEIEKRYLRPIIPRYSRLVEEKRGEYTVHLIRHSIVGVLRRGYLYTRILRCTEPRYIQKTVIRASVNHDRDVVERIVLSGECTEW